ncbi:DUF2750 domain-containing protein [Arthrobacter sp. UNC362MFTsu5.1]|uniref:DUF2750 domain-containing protein n=1 Tax=Arthrobacter sp. UNC362MFTsu5.1 TaxID=1449044 RepID=UPI001E43C7AB|nr:DUF2750 domain-containing protein [Arthrobacter sp. UNC362MFTsu5.1]
MGELCAGTASARFWKDVFVSTSAAHASAFYSEILHHQEVWTVRDANGFPAPAGPDGQRSMPFWSRPSRVERIVASVPDYRDFDVVSLPLQQWRSNWLPGLQGDGILVGLNWSGTRATGFDVSPDAVLEALAFLERAED